MQRVRRDRIQDPSFHGDRHGARVYGKGFQNAIHLRSEGAARRDERRNTAEDLGAARPDPRPHARVVAARRPSQE